MIKKDTSTSTFYGTNWGSWSPSTEVYSSTSLILDLHTHIYDRQARASTWLEKSNTVTESEKGNRVTQTARERKKEKEQNKNGNEIQQKKKSKRVRKIEK